MPELAPGIWQLAVAVSVLLMSLFIISGLRREPPGDLTVCLLCRNQAADLEYMVRRMLSVLGQRAARRRIQLVIVDAGSTDETGRIAERLARSSPAVRVLTGSAGWRYHLLQLHRRGRGSAVLAFWPESRRDWEAALGWADILARGAARRSDPRGECADDQ